VEKVAEEVNLYWVIFSNGWQTLQIAESESEARAKAVECFSIWFTDEPVIWSSHLVYKF
jgi:hypothetical protein